MQRLAACYLLLTTAAVSRLTDVSAELSAGAQSLATPHRTTRHLSQLQSLTHRAVLSAEAVSAASSHTVQRPPASGALRSLSANADGARAVSHAVPSQHVGLTLRGNFSHARPRRRSHLTQRSPVSSSSTTAAGTGHEAKAVGLKLHTSHGFLHEPSHRADDDLVAALKPAGNHHDSLVEASDRVGVHSSMVATQASSSAIPLSTHECWWEGTPEEEADFEALTPDSHHTVCRYTNLLIWEQQVGSLLRVHEYRSDHVYYTNSLCPKVSAYVRPGVL